MRRFISASWRWAQFLLDADVAHPVYSFYGSSALKTRASSTNSPSCAAALPPEVHVVALARTPTGMGALGWSPTCSTSGWRAVTPTMYLRGPVMVDAARTRLDHNGFHRVGLYNEKFVASAGGERRRTPARLITRAG